jgi:Ca2+-binding RTX toxin-like protein
VQVSDGALTDDESVTVAVDQGNAAPTADAGGAYRIAEGDDLVLDASATTDPNTGQDDPLTYEWDLDSDGDVEVTGISPTLTAAQLADFGLAPDTSYTTTLRVTDSFGQTDTDTATLFIDRAAPTLAISASDAGGDGDGTFTLDEPIALTFAFGEAVSGFDESKIVLDGGALVADSFTRVAGDRYTVQATFTRPGSVAVADGAFADGVGHDGTGGRLALQVVGTAGNDTIVGSVASELLEGRDGDDILFGGGGADNLIGGKGNDGYHVDSASDVVVELDAPGEGTFDRVRASVDYALAAAAAIETLATNDAAGTDGIDLTGNDFANFIRGNAGVNVLTGLGGADILLGGAGADTLTGGTGEDAFVFDSDLVGSSGNRITDFSHRDNTIHLDNAVFSELLTEGALADGAFKNFALGRIDADDRILYNGNTGTLFYDADGRGGDAAVAFATLLGSPNDVSTDDFRVI